jgi:hypothetical protein
MLLDQANLAWQNSNVCETNDVLASRKTQTGIDALSGTTLTNMLDAASHTQPTRI